MEQEQSWLNPLSLPFVEELYESYLEGRDRVSEDWRAYFDSFEKPAINGEGNGNGARVRPTLAPRSVFNPANGGAVSAPAATAAAPAALGVVDAIVRQDRVDQLIRAYRVRGHMIAKVDPLNLPRSHPPELDPEFYGLGDDLDRSFSARTIAKSPVMTLREILNLLNSTYCRSIGVQFMHIDDLEVKNWLQDRMEHSQNRLRLDRDPQLRILTKLTDSVMFEEFVQKKYLGAKSFSLEGSESLIPLLMFAIDRAAAQGVEQVVLGMAHRGRLNVLANILGKSARSIFREFDDRDPQLYIGSGDVKYHLGHSSDWLTPDGKKVHLSLTFNPSHLEYVNPVVLGRVRAKQDRMGDGERERV